MNADRQARLHIKCYLDGLRGIDMILGHQFPGFMRAVGTAADRLRRAS